VVVRQAGKVIKRMDRDQTGNVVVNVGDHPDAETPDAEEWTPFERAVLYQEGRRIESPDGVETWKNSIYTVTVHREDNGSAYLSIKANDRHWRHDWRHLQRIKNELLGEEVEALELYPATSRVVDDANQFHLWAFAPGFRIPTGFAGPDTETPQPESGYCACGPPVRCERHTRAPGRSAPRPGRACPPK